MIYDENHDHDIERHPSGEIACTWVFAISLIGVLLLVLGMAD